MKELHIDQGTYSFAGTGIHRRFTIMDDAVADAAYAKLRDAMAEYRERGNDRQTTVEIDFGDGKATIKVEAIMNVIVLEVGHATSVETAVAQARHEKAVKDRLKAEGLWEEKPAP